MWAVLISVKAFITFPKEDNDLLICFASSKTLPYAIVLLTFSLPARSTIVIFADLALPSFRLF